MVLSLPPSYIHTLFLSITLSPLSFSKTLYYSLINRHAFLFLSLKLTFYSLAYTIFLSFSISDTHFISLSHTHALHLSFSHTRTLSFFLLHTLSLLSKLPYSHTHKKTHFLTFAQSYLSNFLSFLSLLKNLRASMKKL